jgi:membrane-bound lytic murein transglycosylase D
MRPTTPPLRRLVPLIVLLSSMVARADARMAAGLAAEQALPETAGLAEQAIPPARVPDAALVPPPPVSAPLTPRAARVEEAWADVPDEPPIAAEIDKDSADIEAMRKAEEALKLQQTEGAATGEGRIDLIPELKMTLAQLRAKYDIPIDVNAAVVAYIRFFQSPVARSHFVKWLGRSYRYLDRYREILKEEGLPEDTVYLAMIESGFGNFAYSRAKASGPWQFIAPTGKLYGLRQDFWVDERRDPEKSAHAAARFLKRLYEQTGDWRLAWAGYNAGVGRIFKARDRGYADFWDMASAPGKKVLRAETKGYVPKLMAAAIVSKHPQAFGFTDTEIEKQDWMDYEEVTIPSATLLTVIAKAAGVSEREILDLNPELRRSCTPPRPYDIKIPSDSADTFAANWPEIQPKIRLTFAGHVVRRGDTIAGIARRYGVPPQAISEMNGVRGRKRLKPGMALVIPRPVGAPAVADASMELPDLHRAKPVRARARTIVAAAVRPTDRAQTTHRVAAGDTLWSISQRFGVQLGDLCRWNGIKNPKRHKLLVGARLVVYPVRG